MYILVPSVDWAWIVEIYLTVLSILKTPEMISSQFRGISVFPVRVSSLWAQNKLLANVHWAHVAKYAPRYAGTLIKLEALPRGFGYGPHRVR